MSSLNVLLFCYMCRFYSWVIIQIESLLEWRLHLPVLGDTKYIYFCVTNEDNRRHDVLVVRCGIHQESAGTRSSYPTCTSTRVVTRGMWCVLGCAAGRPMQQLDCALHTPLTYCSPLPFQIWGQKNKTQEKERENPVFSLYSIKDEESCLMG